MSLSVAFDCVVFDCMSLAFQYLCCFSGFLLAMYTCASFAASALAAAKPTPVFAPVIMMTFPYDQGGLKLVYQDRRRDDCQRNMMSHLLVWDIAWTPSEVDPHADQIGPVSACYADTGSSRYALSLRAGRLAHTLAAAYVTAQVR